MCIARKSAAKKHSLPNSTKKKKEKKEKNAKTKKSVEKSTTPTPTSTPPATTSPPPAKKSETIGGGGGGGGKKPSQIKIVEIESKKSLTTALPANTPPVKKVANGGGGGENHLKAPRIGKSLTPTTIEKNVASNVKMKTTRRKSTDKEEWSVWNDKTEFLENAQLTKLMSNDDIRALIGKAAQQTENDETSCRDTIDEVDSEMQNMIFSPLLIPVQNNEIQPTQEFPYNWLSSIISSSIYFIHIIGIFYCFVAFNLRSSHNRTKSYLRKWYHFNFLIQIILMLLFIPEIVWNIFNGWHYSICTSDTLFTGPMSGSVVAIWTFSKMTDLVETFLLIYDSRKPLAIHIIHHFVSLSYAFSVYATNFAFQRWIIVPNLISHVILYGYLSHNKIFNWVPCWASVCISQMVQLILPFILSFSVSLKLSRGIRCDASSMNLILIQIGLIVLIVLFSDFYYTRIQKFRQKSMRKMRREEEEEKKKTSSEQAAFENDFPDLRSVIFSP